MIEIRVQMDPEQKHDRCVMWFYDSRMVYFFGYDLKGKYSFKKELKKNKENLLKELKPFGYTKADLKEHIKLIMKSQKKTQKMR